MPGFDGSDKHCTLKDLLELLGVADSTNNNFYTSGGEITKAGLQEALAAAFKLKKKVEQLASEILKTVR